MFSFLRESFLLEAFFFVLSVCNFWRLRYMAINLKPLFEGMSCNDYNVYGGSEKSRYKPELQNRVTCCDVILELVTRKHLKFLFSFLFFRTSCLWGCNIGLLGNICFWWLVVFHILWVFACLLTTKFALEGIKNHLFPNLNFENF